MKSFYARLLAHSNVNWTKCWWSSTCILRREGGEVKEREVMSFGGEGYIVAATKASNVVVAHSCAAMCQMILSTISLLIYWSGCCEFSCICSAWFELLMLSSTNTQTTADLSVPRRESDIKQLFMSFCWFCLCLVLSKRFSSWPWTLLDDLWKALVLQLVLFLF